MFNISKHSKKEWLKMKLERLAGVSDKVSVVGELCLNVGKSFHMKYDSTVHIKVHTPIGKA